MDTFCICGGGSLGHVIAGVLSSIRENPLKVNILTGKPELWSDTLEIRTPQGKIRRGRLNRVSSDPEDVIPQADIVLICLPGPLIRDTLTRIKDHLADGAYVGGVFSSTGFFFEAMNILPENIKLWGFQRVPFIARTSEYGRSANILGYKKEHKIAIERATDEEKESFRAFLEGLFVYPTVLLSNHLEASITNSNPLLHTSRLYTMFKDWEPGTTYPRNYLFYEEWTEDAAELYIKMDAELAELTKVLPVSPDFLQRVLDYYESYDALSLKEKLSSIESFKGILSPMKEVSENQWVPDFESRYFVEDFCYSLRYLYDLAEKYGVDTPYINMVLQWGEKHICRL